MGGWVGWWVPDGPSGGWSQVPQAVPPLSHAWGLPGGMTAGVGIYWTYLATPPLPSSGFLPNHHHHPGRTVFGTMPGIPVLLDLLRFLQPPYHTLALPTLLPLLPSPDGWG